MRNIFAQTKDYVDPPKRNVFDLSHSNHSTFQFGYLYPVLCQPVIPGDSFNIDPTFALRFLPTAFPVQTKITANLHFFYVRNRNLWDKWTKFIGHTHDTEFPYLDGSQDCIKTGGLADYLGVPTTIVTSGYGTVNETPFRDMMYPFSANLFRSLYLADGNDVWNFGLNYSKLFGGSLEEFVNSPTASSSSYNRVVTTLMKDDGFTDPIGSYFEVFADTTFSSQGVNLGTTFIISVRTSQGNYARVSFSCIGSIVETSASGVSRIRFTLDSSTKFFDYRDVGVEAHVFKTQSEIVSYLNGLIGDLPYDISLYQIPASSTRDPQLWIPYEQPSDGQILGSPYFARFDIVVGQDGVRDIDSDPSKNPFISSNPDSIRLNALPFRAYESIYNAFYRNEQNDPLMINGEPEYDKYLPNDGSGADSFPYQLYKRNWELDFLSSAVQSPQQGIAPLVGVSSSGDFTFVHKDDNGNIGYFSAKAQISADGKSISGVQLSDSVELDGLPTTPIVADIPESVKRGSVYTLNQMALAGISINDFRNVNSLQRWLETNIRRGFKYRDQIKSHFGIDVDFDVLDMPEFIGGISEPVYSSQVNQTSETANDPLGSYAGQLSLIASSKHSIRHYCHEHGYIIGIFSVIPVPNYSQLLPKDFIKSNYLDFYFPEFSHIGMQPIDYREVCPLQAYRVDSDNLLKTFGYQRPWYDYIANVDSVHGLFRTNLRNFVLNRQFDTLPMLNKDFLQVDPSQLNDIFTVDDVSDKILGQIQFNITAKRPIPRFGIPRLE